MKKKPTSIRLHIQEPCSQPFNKMHSLPGGRHCDKCEKTVVDFTQMSDGEIVRLYQKNKGRICGVFRNDQLNRSMMLPLPIEKSRNWKAVAAFAAALTFSHMATGQANNIAVGKIATHQSEMLKGEVAALDAQPKTSDGFQVIQGKVVDENGEPLIGATIQKSPSEGTVTDFDGHFTLKIPASVSTQKITVTYLGFEDQSIIWEKGNDAKLDVVMKVAATDLTMVEVVGYGQVVRKGVLMGAIASIHEEETIKLDTIESEESQLKMPYVPTLEVFPNPFTSHVSVQIEMQQPDAILFHLYNEAGQLLLAETHELPIGTQTIQLDLSQRDLPEGVYFLRISDNIGEVRTKRIVKVSP